MSCKPSSTRATSELQAQQHTSYLRAAQELLMSCKPSSTGAAYELQAQQHRSCL